MPTQKHVPDDEQRTTVHTPDVEPTSVDPTLPPEARNQPPLKDRKAPPPKPAPDAGYTGPSDKARMGIYATGGEVAFIKDGEMVKQP